MEGNFEWFLAHYNEIYGLCGECHVVIKNKRIIKIFEDHFTASRWVDENGLLGKVNVQYCNGDESAYIAYIY